ncbi:MAG TPA: MFS transporter [Rhizomicrobium sp.]|jgi:SHS family lactate transporter-like MFS transporter
MAFEGLKGWTSTQKHVVTAAYLGWTLDAFDFLLLTLVAKDVAREFGRGALGIGIVLTATLALRPLGAFIFGRLADRYGRRPILMLDVLLYSALAAASALAPSWTAFVALRCLFGIAMGGEWGIGASLTMEHVRPDSRGLVSGLLQTGYPTGSLIAAGVTALFLPALGWRGLMLLSILPALLVLYIRRNVPESPAWLAAPSRRDNTWEIARKHWPRALFAILLMIGFNSLSHGTQDFYPNFLRIQHALDSRTAAIIVAIGSLGAIFGGLVFGMLSQRVGRRRAIALAALLVLPAIPFWAYWSQALAGLALSVFVLQFMVQGAWGVVPAHLNELSPARARGTFPGFVYQLGNLGASGIGVLQGALVEKLHWSYGQALALVAASAAVVIGVLVSLGPEAHGIDMRGGNEPDDRAALSRS